MYIYVHSLTHTGPSARANLVRCSIRKQNFRVRFLRARTRVYVVETSSITRLADLSFYLFDSQFTSPFYFYVHGQQHWCEWRWRWNWVGPESSGDGNGDGTLRARMAEHGSTVLNKYRALIVRVCCMFLWEQTLSAQECVVFVVGNVGGFCLPIVVFLLR